MRRCGSSKPAKSVTLSVASDRLMVAPDDYQRRSRSPPPPPPLLRSTFGLATLTVICRPPISEPFRPSIAALPSSSLAISTNPKPRDRPVHGACLAACTNIGLGYNFKACQEDFAALAGIMAAKEESVSTRASGEDFLLNLQKLICDLDLPSKPSELGIKKEDAQTLLDNTLIQTRRIKTNPRPLDDELLSFIKRGI